MVRIFISLLISLSCIHAKSYDKECLTCHNKLPITFDKFYMQYLIKFSSNKRIKEAMFYYLKDPKKEQSVMNASVVKKLGLMPKLDLDDKTLEELIQRYINSYDIKKHLH